MLFIGGPEIVLILLLVVMLFGAKRIPEIARGLAKGMKEVRNVTDEIKREINTSGASNLNQMGKEVKQAVDKGTETVNDLSGSIAREVRKPFQQAAQDLDKQAPDKPKEVAKGEGIDKSSTDSETTS